MGDLRQRRIGIVGGMGPAAGHYFAQRVTELVPATKDQDHPTIIHVSNPRVPDRTAYLIADGADPVPYIMDTIGQLELLKVDVICIPCNSAHAPSLFARYAQDTATPIIHMVNETIVDIVTHHPKASMVGVLGTTGTVMAGSYHAAAAGTDLTVVAPEPSQQERLMQVIYDIKSRGCEPEDVEALDGIARALTADVYVVACTELSMLTPHWRDRSTAAIIDSLEVLAQRALAFTPSVLPSSSGH